MNGQRAFSRGELRAFRAGESRDAYRRLGAHPAERDGVSGVHFAVWAPEAQSVSVALAQNGWSATASPFTRSEGGIWELFYPGIGAGEIYRYVIRGADGCTRYKSDPYAFRSELRPANASIVCPLDGYKWDDALWERTRPADDYRSTPMAIYELHPGSWKRHGDGSFLSYRELAPQIAEYVNYMGFTHVELIGICEHPLDASWGYQVTGYYSPTSRYGTPDDFRYFVDTLHRAGIGVILDWVPAHFPKDEFGLAYFDGSALYESDEPLLAEYPEWGTMAFDHSKGGVRSFLRSNAFYWVNEFHIDALRVDAVAAMLYMSFGRGQWQVNEDGSTENRDSIAFLRSLNESLRIYSHAFLIAEDSSIMPGITAPVADGGLGFGYKWNMGWMHDTLQYIRQDPIFRGWHHDWLTHSADYAFLEQFILVLSHDEVVHLKRPMLEKFPGSLQDKLGGLKSFYTYMFTHPGKKLLFMGQEFAENREWSEDRSISWELADDPGHRDVMECLRCLLRLYREIPCLYTDSGNPTTFEWINRSDAMRSTISFIRRNPWNYNDAVLVICSFAPVEYENYTCGAPVPGYYSRLFSSYDTLPGGGGPEEMGMLPPLMTEESPCDGYKWKITYNLRPYESVLFRLPQSETDT